MAQTKGNKGKTAPAYSADSMALRYVGGLILVAVGVLIFLSVAVEMSGDVFAGARQVCEGLTGSLSILLAVFPIWGGVLMIISAQRKPPFRAMILSVLLYLLLLTIANLISITGQPTVPLMDYILDQNKTRLTSPDTFEAFLARAYELGSKTGMGGGLMGMLLAWPLWKLMGVIPAAIVSFLLAGIDLTFLFHLDVKKLIDKIRARGEQRRVREEEEQKRLAQQNLQWQQQMAARNAAMAAQPYPRPVPPVQQSMWQQPGAWPQDAAYPAPNPPDTWQPGLPEPEQPSAWGQNAAYAAQSSTGWGRGAEEPRAAEPYAPVRSTGRLHPVSSSPTPNANGVVVGFQPTGEEHYAVATSDMYQEQIDYGQPDVRRGADGGSKPHKSRIFGGKKVKAAEQTASQDTPISPAVQDMPSAPEDGYAPAQTAWDAAPAAPRGRTAAQQAPSAPEDGYAPAQTAWDAAPAAPRGRTAAPYQDPSLWADDTGASRSASWQDAPVWQADPTPEETPIMRKLHAKEHADPIPLPTPGQTGGAQRMGTPVTSGNAPRADGYTARPADAKPTAPAQTNAPRPSDAGYVPRTAGMTAAGAERQPMQQPKPSWSDTPPWEEAPAPKVESAWPTVRDIEQKVSQLRDASAGKPATSASVRVPVVQQDAPRETWTPELHLPPRKEQPAPEEPEEEQPRPYVYPAMSLLKTPEPPSGNNAEEDALRSRRLEETLQSFKIPAKVRHVTHGPAISRFELEIAAGIRVNKITELDRNIAMNMEVKSVRIEAPIPGKSLVGVEVPNRKVSSVTLREVLETDVMGAMKSPLGVALGKDIAGSPIVCDLARMPHLLIAGATGSGKSVCVNAMINSILFRCSPREVRMILIDPKVVELQCYNGIPHLLIPVVSDPHKAAGALEWAVAEMMDRYKKFQLKGAREISGFNQKLGEGEEFMPRIIIVIDELADLMMSCRKDVEERICRLAQLARAAGIHLVVATQRPSVDVITGLIKANIPSRIAFKVSSFIDSRTILDRPGADKLLGYGDMLYLPNGEFTPIRVQGCFLTDGEVNRITDFIRQNSQPDYDPNVLEQLEQAEHEADAGADSAEAENDPNSDESLLAQAIEMTVQDGQVSTSMLQRRLRVGFSRAGRLVDEMEKRGVVSAKDGTKPRVCLISREEFEQMKQSGDLDE